MSSGFSFFAPAGLVWIGAFLPVFLGSAVSIEINVRTPVAILRLLIVRSRGQD